MPITSTAVRCQRASEHKPVSIMLCRGGGGECVGMIHVQERAMHDGAANGT